MTDSTEIVYEEVSTYAADSMAYSNDSLQVALDALSMAANDPQAGGLLNLILGIGAGIIFVFLALVIFLQICYWKIFVKAGHPGWASLIPFYSLYIYFKIINKPLWWILLMIIPIVNIIFAIKMTHALSTSFGKGAGFTVGLIFLPIVFYAILAFDSSTYQNSVAKSSGALDSNV